jgi:replicative superfamily II helicase
MAIKFDELLDDEEAAVIDPRDIFLTLNRDKKFAFPRDIQTEVIKAWFGQRDNPDMVVKLNVGSGKTLVGLLLLQSSLNEGIRPAICIAPDKQLVDQVLAEANALGIDAVDDPRDTAVQSGEKIAVTTVHRLFNGKSIFGVGSEGVKLKIGAIVIDDVHACIATINEQFRIQLHS